MNTLSDGSAVVPQMSATEFAELGMEDVAFIKVTEVDGEIAYAIHTADGNPVAVVDDRDAAFATVIQNDLQPVSVH